MPEAPQALVFQRLAGGAAAFDAKGKETVDQGILQGFALLPHTRRKQKVPLFVNSLEMEAGRIAGAKIAFDGGAASISFSKISLRRCSI